MLSLGIRCFRREASKHMANPNKLQRALFLTAQFVLLAVAAICLYYAHNSFMIRSVGTLAIFASLAIVRRSRTLPASPEVRAMQSAWALKPWHWLVGLGLILTVAATLASLALLGFHDPRLQRRGARVRVCSRSRGLRWVVGRAFCAMVQPLTHSPIPGR